MNIYKWNTPNTKYPDFNKLLPIKHYKNNTKINKYIFIILITVIIIILFYYNGY